MTTLPQVLDITGAQALRQSLLTELDADPPTLELAAIEEADTASLQLLVAFVADAKRLGRPALLAHPSAPFLGIAQTLGLLAALGLAEVQPAAP